MKDDNNVASNPEAEGHLPVGGEIVTSDGTIAPDITDDAEPLVDEYE